VIECHGSSISQLLSSRITEARPQDIAELEVSPFDAEEDAFIWAFIEDAPKQVRRWQKLAE
jgi:hypothetical protein